jgi:hypothetical protein
MPLKYTGRSTLHIPGHAKPYVAGDVVPITVAAARRLAAGSTMHTFETVAEPPAEPAKPKPAEPKA